MDPRSTPRHGAWRGLTATAACACAAAVLARLAVSASAQAPAPDAMVGTAVLAVGALAAAVLTGGCAVLTVTAVAAGLGHRWSRTEAVAQRVVPAVLRRALTVGVGAGMSLGIGGTALAEDVDVDWQVTSTVSQTSSAPTAPGSTVSGVSPLSAVSPVSAVSRPVPLASPPAPTTPTPGAQPAPAVEPTSIVVQPGDSLWSITASLLPPDAPDAAVAAAWPSLYAANQALVGPDPGLIHPGDVLTVPAGISA